MRCLWRTIQRCGIFNQQALDLTTSRNSSPQESIFIQRRQTFETPIKSCSGWTTETRIMRCSSAKKKYGFALLTISAFRSPKHFPTHGNHRIWPILLLQGTSYIKDYSVSIYITYTDYVLWTAKKRGETRKLESRQVHYEFTEDGHISPLTGVAQEWWVARRNHWGMDRVSNILSWSSMA